jgi:hypothetical protein
MALENENGILMNSTQEMSNIAREYHKKLQASPAQEEEEIHHVNNFLNQVDVQISQESRETLEDLTNEEEINMAFRKSDNNVAPGFDGLPYKFYKYWEKNYQDYIAEKKDDHQPKKTKRQPNILTILTLVFNDIEERGLANTDFILGAMHLLYKKKEKTRIKNYRPITLTNMDYKLFTKTIAMKLGQIAKESIHLDQAGFIPERGLYDHIRLTESVIKYCESTETNGYIMALDQEKAYDKIAHDYLWKALERFGFPQKFIFKIKQLYKGAQTVIMLNGTLPEGIDVKRGVQQGCPMSCLLYNIAIEPLAIALQKSNLKGIKVPGLVDRILASLFADDTLLYLSEKNSIEKVNRIIDKFCKASTAKFNIKKTEILPIGTKEYRVKVEEMRCVNDQPEGRIETGI